LRARSASPALVVKEEHLLHRREGGTRGVRGWNRPGRGAGKSSRAANCPPSYPPYTLSHTLVRNHPYPPLPSLCFPPPRPSHTVLFHTLAYPTSSSPSSSSFSSFSLPYFFRPSRPFSRQPPLRRRHQSFRLPTPYKRSCCPFITTTPATTTTERPTAPTSFPTLPFILHCFPPFIPSSCLLPSSTRTAWRISFVSSFYSQTPP